VIYHKPQTAHVKHPIIHGSGLHSHCEITLKVHTHHNHDGAKFKTQKQMSRKCIRSTKGAQDSTKVFQRKSKLQCVLHVSQHSPAVLCQQYGSYQNKHKSSMVPTKTIINL
jgi:hypothetical protein